MALNRLEKGIFTMSGFTKLVAIAVAFSPLAGYAEASHGYSPEVAYVASASVSNVAANAKGREFQIAGNSKANSGDSSAPKYETPMG